MSCNCMFFAMCLLDGSRPTAQQPAGFQGPAGHGYAFLHRRSACRHAVPHPYPDTVFLSMMKKNRPVLTILLTFLITVAGVLLVLNFSTGETRVNRELPRLCHARSPVPPRHDLLGPALVGGNRARELLNGDQIFPPCCRPSTARSAASPLKPTSTGPATWGTPVRRRRGTRPAASRCMCCWTGSAAPATSDDSFLQEMESGRRGNPQVPQAPLVQPARMNRTHRKLLVVDGKTGFTGGVGIAPNGPAPAEDADHWRDSHYQIEGPAVAQMQAVFMDNWLKVTGR